MTPQNSPSLQPPPRADSSLVKFAPLDPASGQRAGNAADLRRHLRRFDTLTAAIWTVQDALSGSHPVPRQSAAAS